MLHIQSIFDQINCVFAEDQINSVENKNFLNEKKKGFKSSFIDNEEKDGKKMKVEEDILLEEDENVRK